MKEKLLIVEDEFVAANHLRLLVTEANYQVIGMARSVAKAKEIIAEEKPDMVLLDIFLKEESTGIDLARELKKLKIPFIYISANSNADTLLQAKETQPEGFIVKPFRREDILVTLEIAKYRHAEYLSKIHQQEEQAKSSLTQSKPEKINHQLFEGIVGKSPSLIEVFDQMKDVAPTESSVLILGESGTGKERIAQTIHQLSSRSKGPFIKVNCSALPSSLIESELFGHEKGAFTGAIEKRIGKFELANNGTIFLDEIGELNLEMQSKFLRVLQEKEIDRIGSTQVTKVNIRIIAATNRNLEKEVAEGKFRLDLYYRLNVFPIILPALRDRKEDIPLLANYFVELYNSKTGKKVQRISNDAMSTLINYSWPGNIRELEHVIERHILLAKGDQIESISILSLSPTPTRSSKPTVEPVLKSIYENEKDYIIQILKTCNGKIWGKGAAADKLNISPSTLKSKMIRLGISKVEFERPSVVDSF